MEDWGWTKLVKLKDFGEGQEWVVGTEIGKKEDSQDLSHVSSQNKPKGYAQYC